MNLHKNLKWTLPTFTIILIISTGSIPIQTVSGNLIRDTVEEDLLSRQSGYIDEQFALIEDGLQGTNPGAITEGSMNILFVKGGIDRSLNFDEDYNNLSHG